ncbi:MAG: hypothetical protein ACRDNH_00530 [Gaiellaceae bacterium]
MLSDLARAAGGEHRRLVLLEVAVGRDLWKRTSPNSEAPLQRVA